MTLIELMDKHTEATVIVFFIAVWGVIGIAEAFSRRRAE